MTQTVKNDQILEFLNKISPSLLPYVITGAEALDFWPVACVDGSQGQKVKRRGRPRKQAENGPADDSAVTDETTQADGSQADGETVKSPLSGWLSENPTRREIAEFFVEKYPIPPVVCSGSQWFRFDEELGWIPARIDDVRDFVTQFLIYNLPDSADEGTIRHLVNWSKGVWNIKKKQGAAYFLEMNLENNIPRLTARSGAGWIPCRNVLLNVRTGETRDFTQALFTVGRVPCNYDPAAACPRWERFLQETLAPESAAVLQEFFGVSLTFDRSFQGFAILYGEGGNGKGVVCEILKTLNAGAVCAVSLAGLGDRFSRYPLTVCRVNIHPDTNSRINKTQIPEMEEILKAGAMGESVYVEKKGVDGETRPLLALMIFAMNPPFPAFLDCSEGINRRVRVIHFQRTFAGTQGENNHLAEELKEELPGILNWAVAGYRRLIDSGAKRFSNTEAGKRVVSDSRKLNHPEETFFDEFLTVTENGLVSSRKVYERYRKWTEETGNNFPMAENKFSARLLAYFQKAGAQVEKERRRNLRYYTGLELEGDLEGF